MHPAGRNFSKIIKDGRMPNLAWPFERFSETADYLTEKYNLKVLITGSKEEKFIGEIVSKKCKNKLKIYNVCGDFSFMEITTIMQKAKLLVSIDTASIHIAEFTGTPVIALFGPTFPEEIGPYGDKKKIFHYVIQNIA